MPALTLQAYYGNVLAPRLAQMLRDALREVLSVQAPVIRLPSGAVVAATPAEPNAPPRKVSGRLWGNIVVRGNKVYLNQPYAKWLEKDHHRYIERAVQLLKERSRSQRVRIAR